MWHKEADKQLMTPFNDYGSYLIRKGYSHPDEYTLSIRDTEKVRHYRIIQLDDGEFSITRRVVFMTIQDLVAYYQQQADGLCTNLVKPCILFEKPQTADLSRQVYDEWEIDRRQIRMVRKLESSEFVEVWEGLWNGTTPVAVKTPRPGKLAVDNFLQTANLMKKMQHPNIIHLYALCTKEEPVYIITEFIRHDSLLEYLRGVRRSLKLPQLIDMASQVAAGMAYLEEQNITHRDLAARNILVGGNLICKVANFEMAQLINAGIDNPRSLRLAVKWTAPEAAQYDRFTVKSDVWSYGIVLYEVITYGCPPYPGMTNTEALEAAVKGYRMPQPPGCPDKLYNIMLNCWREEPKNRPLFEALQWQLEDLFINLR